jgi:hypothetical protein
MIFSFTNPYSLEKAVGIFFLFRRKTLGRICAILRRADSPPIEIRIPFLLGKNP